jgi:putative ABC transport system permease protein
MEGIPNGNRKRLAAQQVVIVFRLALRNVFRQKARTAMTLAAIVFGVIGLILSGGFVRDITIQLGEALIHSQSGHLQVSKTGYFTYGSRSPEKYRIAAPDVLTRQIAAMPEVDAVMVRISFSGLLNNGRTDWPIIGEGVEPDKEAKLGSFMHISEGRQLTDTDTFGLTLGQGVAKALNVKPGDRVSLLLNTAEGALNNLEFEVVGVFQSFSKDFDARAVRIALPAARELLGSASVNSLVLSLKKTADTDSVAAKLATMFASGEYETRSWVQLNDFFEKTIALYDQQFGFLQLIILMMVLLSVANTVNMSVFERVGEFGTMMSLGNRRGDVFRLVLVENALLGLIGSGLGVVLGILLALAISAVGIPMPPPPNSNLGYTAFIRIVPLIVIGSFVIGFVATMLAALLPAMRVTRIPVVDALRQNI